MTTTSPQSKTLSYQAVFEQLPTGVVIIDGKGYVEQCNQAAQLLLGDDICGKRWLDVIASSFAPKEDDGHEVSLKDGRRINVAISSLQDRPGEMIVLNDLTATRVFEHERARLMRLQEMGEMLSHLAHQIRTPLSAAMLYVKNLSHPNLSEEKKINFINKIRFSHQNIEQQIRDLLAFAKGGDSLLETINMHHFLDMIEKRAEVKLTEMQSELIIDNQVNGLTFLCHSEALEGAICNLIDNALNANANRIFLNVACHQNNLLMFNIVDDGDGMDDDTIKKVLRPFYTTRAKGTGLGLAVVDAVVKSHHGQMKIISTPGIGSTFSIQIPIIHELIEKEPQ